MSADDVARRPGNPLRRLFLAALLWLPAMFFVWVYWSSVFVLPATTAAQAVLESRFGGLFQDVYRGFPRHLIAADSRLPVAPGTPTEGASVRDDHVLVLRFTQAAMTPAMRAEKRETGVEPLPTVNTLIYGYGLALIWGLVLATPLSGGRRLAQMAAGWLAIAAVQAFGAVGNALVVAMNFLGAQALVEQGLNPELVALAYQFGYLILPAVVPVILWMLMNRRFIETLTGRIGEPPPVAPVPPLPTGPHPAPGRDPET
jgi:hypothetical protein